MEANFIGGLGSSSFLSNNKRRTTKIDEYLDLENKRFKFISKGIVKLKELEDEKLGITGLIMKQGGELVNFKLIKENQILSNGPPPISYTKNSYLDQGDLLYKVLKAEGRLIRSVLEAHGFNHTDGHDWNLLWTCTS